MFRAHERTRESTVRARTPRDGEARNRGSNVLRFTWRVCSIACRALLPAAGGNVLPWRVRSSRIRKHSCSTSRWRISIRRCARRVLQWRGAGSAPARFQGPILYVTHDHAEAMMVGDELAVLIDGRIEDAGEPQRVYDRPRTVAVARALGERAMNLLATNGAIVGIRPEHVRIADDGDVRGTIVRRESTGPDIFLRVETNLGEVSVRLAQDREALPVRRPRRAGFCAAVRRRRFDASTGVAIA